MQQIYVTFAGAFLVAWGILLLRKPNLFRRGMWMKTGIAERNLSPKGYIKYSRSVGVFNIGPRHRVFGPGIFHSLGVFDAIFGFYCNTDCVSHVTV